MKILSLVTGKLDVALEHFTEAIICNPHSAILFANRGTIILEEYHQELEDYSFGPSHFSLL